MGDTHVGILGYRIAGNFRGPYISRIAIKFIFVETNFRGLHDKGHTHPSLACCSWLAVKFMTWTPRLQGPVD